MVAARNLSFLKTAALKKAAFLLFQDERLGYKFLRRARRLRSLIFLDRLAEGGRADLSLTTVFVLVSFFSEVDVKGDVQAVGDHGLG